jgi:hypothetical protein
MEHVVRARLGVLTAKPDPWASDQLGCSKYMSDAIVALLTGACASGTTDARCVRIKKVGLYSSAGSLVKVLDNPTFSTPTTPSFIGACVAVEWLDTSTDAYSFDRFKVFGLPVSLTDVDNNYRELAKYVMDGTVVKAPSHRVRLRVEFCYPVARSMIVTAFFQEPLKEFFARGYDYYSECPFNKWELLNEYYGVIDTFTASAPTVISGTIPYFNVPYQGVKWQDTVTISTSLSIRYLALTKLEPPRVIYDTGGMTLTPGGKTLMVHIIQYYSYTPSGPGIPSTF